MKMIAKLATVFVIAGSLAACGGGGSISTSEIQTARDGAMTMASNMGAKYLSCSGEDSDRDGYVSCSVQTAATATVPSEIKEIQCGYKQPGCKPSKK